MQTHQDFYKFGFLFLIDTLTCCFKVLFDVVLMRLLLLVGLDGEELVAIFQHLSTMFQCTKKNVEMSFLGQTL